MIAQWPSTPDLCSRNNTRPVQQAALFKGLKTPSTAYIILQNGFNKIAAYKCRDISSCDQL